MPADATLPDARMCQGYSAYFWSSSTTLAQCRARCDSSSRCAGFSWGLMAERRRTLLAHDEPAVDGATGRCYLLSSMPTSSFVASSVFTSAGCYAKGARLPTCYASHKVAWEGCSCELGWNGAL